mgnify:CR=1 FL=1
MTTFVMTGRYSAEAVKGISSGRTAKAGQIARKCGGRIVEVYATMGRNDLLVISEFPGVGEAMKASVAFNKEFGIAFSTVPALPVKEFDKLVGRK